MTNWLCQLSVLYGHHFVPPKYYGSPALYRITAIIKFSTRKRVTRTTAASIMMITMNESPKECTELIREGT